MHPEMEMLRCAIVRGGTSKAGFIMMNEYPKDPAKRDAVILAAYGSPDVRQIDGLGGADVLTSKHEIISPSSQPGADVDYTFAQVSLDSAFVDYHANCGNISSAVGPLAIDEGLVEAVEPVTTVRIRMTNSNKILVAEVPVKGGKAMVDGDLTIDGVPGAGAKIAMDWSDANLRPAFLYEDLIGASPGRCSIRGTSHDLASSCSLATPIEKGDFYALTNLTIRI